LSRGRPVVLFAICSNLSLLSPLVTALGAVQ